VPRAPRIKDDEILAAARAIFLEKGIRGTTAEVAERAGIAEGSIFNRFPSKAALFQAAMRPTLEEPAWVPAALAAVGQGEVVENLVELGTQVLEFLRSILPIVMMSWSNPGQVGSIPDALAGPNPPPVRVLRAIGQVLEGEMKLGRIARRDPELLARVFLGSLQNYAFFEVLLRAQELMPLPTRTYVRGVVDLLWEGVAPARPPTPTPARPRAKRK
jgi:AcrR family transcriptional regulator